MKRNKVRRVLALLLCFTVIFSMTVSSYAEKKELAEALPHVTMNVATPSEAEEKSETAVLNEERSEEIIEKATPSNPTKDSEQEDDIADIVVEDNEDDKDVETIVATYSNPESKCTCGAEDGVHEEECPLYKKSRTSFSLARTADVYTVVEGEYVKLEGHGQDSPIDVEEYDGKTVFVISSEHAQKLYFERESSLIHAGAKFSLSGDIDYATLATGSNAWLGDNKTIVTLAEDIPVGSEIVLHAKSPILSWEYTVTIVVVDDIEESKSTTKVELKDGTVVTAAGIPEGAELIVEEATAEKVERIDQIVVNSVGFDSDLVNGNELFYKTYNIGVKKEGENWQPEDGETVEIGLNLGVDWLNYRSYVQVVHILDTAEAINAAETKYLHFGEELENLFPAACEAAIEAGYPEGVIVYTVMTGEAGEVSVASSSSITINATSFSDYTILAYNVDNSEYISETEETGLNLDKTATVDPESREGTVELSSYVKGSVESTPTDVVLVIDHSGSMWSAVDPSEKLEFDDFVQDTAHGTREGYYVAITKEKKAISGTSKESYFAYLIRYNNGQWQISNEFYGNGVDSVQAANAFINTCIGTDRSWTELTEAIASELDFYKSISGALYDALNVFMEKMKDAVNCRVAIVTFSGSTSEHDAHELSADKDYVGSGIFMDRELVWNPTYNIGNDYSAAFEIPSTDEGYSTLIDEINMINTDYGSTPTALGLLYARRCFIYGDPSKERTNANRIAIVFTDGLPNPIDLKTRGREYCQNFVNHDTNSCEYCNEFKYTVNDEEKSTLVSTYVDQAQMLKTQQQATVYSIGPTAGNAGVDVLRKIASDDSKFYNVGSGDLNQTFEDIAGVIVASSQELNKDSVALDEISESFMLPEGTTAANIKVYTETYTGKDDDGKDTFGNRQVFEDAKVEIDGRVVKVSNFDYQANAVYMAGDNPHGMRLVIEIPIIANPDFLGGDVVDTNAGTSGVYNGNTPAGKFPRPTADIYVSEIAPQFAAKDIYVSQVADLPQVMNIGGFSQGGKSYVVDGINNAYVEIVYTLTDQNTGKSITCTIPAGAHETDLTKYEWEIPEGMTLYPLLDSDTTYKVSCSVTSTNRTTNNSYEDSSETIHVFKPVITFKDSVIDLGETADYDDNLVEGIIWIHDSVKFDSEVMGTAPTLAYSYNPIEAAFTEDTPVQVTVTSKSDGVRVLTDQDISQYVTFYRKKCSFNSCDNYGTGDATLVETDSNGKRVNFVVHIGKFDLKICKEGADTELDKNQTFLFRVTGPNSFKMDVAVVGNGSVVIKSLPVGEYTVTELISWSWRYEPEEKSYMVNIKDAEEGVVTITVTNSRENKKWLDGNSYCQNVWDESTLPKKSETPDQTTDSTVNIVLAIDSVTKKEDDAE